MQFLSTLVYLFKKVIDRYNRSIFAQIILLIKNNGGGAEYISAVH